MITKIALYEGSSHDPYYNLAVEQYLMETVEEGQCILYLWQNQNTVVIGRNQNPWKECRTTLLNEEGGKLARRLSGGGAVFHDLGNLNFTFLMPQSEYNLDRQLDVIQNAVRKLGIPAERSGRNDILADGRKFSGNAFYKNGVQAYHHGTLIVDVDTQKMGRYLNPSKAKLQSKGVDSVRSRVVNLKELNPDITIEALKKALADVFAGVYGCKVSYIEDNQMDCAYISALTQRNKSWEWNYGHKLPFTMECEDYFPWGTVQVQLQISSGFILDASIFSDSMDWEFASVIAKRLKGIRFETHTIHEALEKVASVGIDVANLICRNI